MTVKNQGYNLEHNFGHGQENLSEILLALNLLSFLFHNVLELVNELYQKARRKLVDGVTRIGKTRSNKGSRI